MPELPEVETIRRGLEQVTLSVPISDGEVLHSRTIAHPLSISRFLLGVKGTQIVTWQRRGKYLLAPLQRRPQSGQQPASSSPWPLDSPDLQAGWLGVHLRMTGQLLWVSPREPLSKHVRVRLFFGSHHELRFVDQRTFGQMWWVPPDQVLLQVIPGLQRLGPEPLSGEFSANYLYQQLHRRQRPIKTALLDQAIVAGIGNIYADEALFLSGILPTTPCTQLSRAQVERLQVALVQVLETSLEVGGTTFRTFRGVSGMNGNYGGVAWVYRRSGEPCRSCMAPIQRLKLAGRSTHFCPQCQV